MCQAQVLIRWGCLLSLAIASSGSSVEIDWTFVGTPANACDTQPQGCFGAVGYYYNIGTYEVTNAQYAEFLNAKAAASDPLALYNTEMGSSKFGGITRDGSPGDYTYSVIEGREDMPVNFVSFYDALRFANWLSNGQGSNDTETGSYTLHGGLPTPSNGATVTRNTGATIFVPTEDEWYKPAYYSPITASYFDYPAGSDTQTTCSTPTGTANRANCNLVVGDLTIKGSYTGSASPYGTFDQGGNVWEWNETILGSSREFRGGSWAHLANNFVASIRNYNGPAYEKDFLGFRVAPEPGRDVFFVAGVMSVLGLAGWRRRAVKRSPRGA